jgi:RimJ/RimL family protein N-acetyltransferase
LILVNSSDLFRGKLVRLTALADDDISTLVQWYQDPHFLRHFDSRPAYPKTEGELRSWLEELRKDERTMAFAVRPLEGDRLVGYLEIDGLDWQHGVCGMGLGIGDPADRGQGFGYEATQLALRYAFDELNLHRVQVTAFAYNRASIALLEKLGFRREGVYRERLQRDGVRYDMLLFGLLRREWEAWRRDSRPGEDEASKGVS